MEWNGIPRHIRKSPIHPPRPRPRPRPNGSHCAYTINKFPYRTQPSSLPTSSWRSPKASKASSLPHHTLLLTIAYNHESHGIQFLRPIFLADLERRSTRSATEMHQEERIRRAVAAAGVADVWALIDAAVAVAARDRAAEARARRDGIVERLYSSPTMSVVGRCPNCDVVEPYHPEPVAPPSPEADVDADGEVDMENEILAITEALEDPDQTEDSLLSLLQNLADMNITYKALKETDIGRHVGGLRKHPSGEVRRLAKQLVRKWKEFVGDWMRVNNSGGDGSSPAIITDADSPQKFPGRNNQNAHQLSEFKYSPSPQKYSPSPHKADGLTYERNGLEPVEPSRANSAGPWSDAPPTKPNYHSSTASSAAPPPRIREQKDSLYDPDKLDSARRRLQENYQEAQNAKKQRTIQVMDIHDIPKPNKNAFFRKAGHGGVQARHHR